MPMAIENFTEYTDSDLWEQVRGNNYKAFDELYRRHWPKLYRAAYKVLKDQQASEDIIQEVFANLWLKRKTTLINSLSSYLYGMVRNQVFKNLRNQKVSREHLDTIQQIVFVEQTEQTVNYAQLLKLYHESVAGLPPRCREVFQLSRNEYLSIKEIASRLDISPKTVENQISKALKVLRVALHEIILLVALLLFI